MLSICKICVTVWPLHNHVESGSTSWIGLQLSKLYDYEYRDTQGHHVSLYQVSHYVALARDQELVVRLLHADERIDSEVIRFTNFSPMIYTIILWCTVSEKNCR
jgi:hypothetical protein